MMQPEEMTIDKNTIVKLIIGLCSETLFMTCSSFDYFFLVVYCHKTLLTHCRFSCLHGMSTCVTTVVSVTMMALVMSLLR